MEDMEVICIPDNDRSHLMESIKDLPKALTLQDQQTKRQQQAIEEQSKQSSQNNSSSLNSNGNSNSSHNNGAAVSIPSLTVEQWLTDIRLEEYKDVFR